MTAVIEAPFTLLQEPVKVVRCDAIEPPQLSLCLVPEVLHSIDVMPALGYEDLAVIDAPMVER